jgi:hypothetical protein
MIKGTYIFYQDGKEIHRSSNVITKFGKRFLTNFIAGNINSNKKDMAIGIDSTTATENDTRLGFEFYRLPVTIGSTDIQTSGGTTTYAVVYKSTIPQDIAGEINEVGIYPSLRSSTNNYDSKFISDFNDYLDWTTSGGFNPTVSISDMKIGDNMLVMQSNSTSAQEYKATISPLDISGYSVNDTIRLAYFKNNTNLSSIKVRLYSSSANYYEATITPESGTGYKISSAIPLSTALASATGSPDKTNINQIGIIITPTSGNTTSVGMDGLRINDEDTFDPIYGIISRSVVTALRKYAGRAIDVEYRLDMTF